MREDEELWQKMTSKYKLCDFLVLFLLEKQGNFGFRNPLSTLVSSSRALHKTIFKSKLTLIKTNRGAHHESAIP